MVKLFTSKCDRGIYPDTYKSLCKTRSFDRGFRRISVFLSNQSVDNQPLARAITCIHL